MATPSAQPQPAAPPASAPEPARPKRSWRRKFRKMRLRFDNAMSQSNALIMDEWKAMGTARRLQAENDQLLDALLDFNDQPRVPVRARFDLAPSPALAPDLPLVKTLAALEASVPHTALADCQPPSLPPAIDLSDHAPGYLDPQHEDDYLLALDALLDDPAYDPRHPPTHLGPPHPPLSEKDLTIRNPDSVYSWLRKNQPQVFLQDKDAPHQDAASDKPKPKKTRPSAVGTPGPDHDDEGPDKARKKADPDDTAYRPKGGSSRPSKRKRDAEGDKARKKRAAGAGTPAAGAGTTTTAPATATTAPATATTTTAPATVTTTPTPTPTPATATTTPTATPAAATATIPTAPPAY